MTVLIIDCPERTKNSPPTNETPSGAKLHTRMVVERKTISHLSIVGHPNRRHWVLLAGKTHLLKQCVECNFIEHGTQDLSKSLINTLPYYVMYPINTSFYILVANIKKRDKF